MYTSKQTPLSLKRMSLITVCHLLVCKSSTFSGSTIPEPASLLKKKLIKILYLQSLPVESVEVFGAPFDLTFVRFLLGVYADVDFQTVRCQEGLATPVLVTDKCVFTYNKSRFCQLVVPIKNFEFILKKLLPVIFLCTV